MLQYNLSISPFYLVSHQSHLSKSNFIFFCVDWQQCIQQSFSIKYRNPGFLAATTPDLIGKDIYKNNNSSCCAPKKKLRISLAITDLFWRDRDHAVDGQIFLSVVYGQLVFDIAIALTIRYNNSTLDI